MSTRVRLDENIKSDKISAKSAFERFSSKESQKLNQAGAIISPAPEMLLNQNKKQLRTRRSLIRAICTVAAMTTIAISTSAILLSKDVESKETPLPVNASVSVTTPISQEDNTSRGHHSSFEDDFRQDQAMKGQIIELIKANKNNDQAEWERLTASTQENLAFLENTNYDVFLMSVTSSYIDQVIADEGERRDEFGNHVAYRDVAGHMTIGYGHAHTLYGEPIEPGKTITEEQARDLLMVDIVDAEYAVRSNVSKDILITQGQFNSLVGFVFNKGEGAFKDSTLLEKLNNNDIGGAAQEFEQWVYANKTDDNGNVIYKDGQAVKVKVDGLVNRAIRDRDMFNSSMDQNYLSLNKTITASKDKFEAVNKEHQASVDNLIANTQFDSASAVAMISSLKTIGQQRIETLTEIASQAQSDMPYLNHTKREHAEAIKEFGANMGEDRITTLMNQIALTDMTNKQINDNHKMLSSLTDEITSTELQIKQIEQIRGAIEGVSSRENIDLTQITYLADELDRLSSDLTNQAHNSDTFNLIPDKGNEILVSYLVEAAQHTQDRLALYSDSVSVQTVPQPHQ